MSGEGPAVGCGGRAGCWRRLGGRRGVSRNKVSARNSDANHAGPRIGRSPNQIRSSSLGEGYMKTPCRLRPVEKKYVDRLRRRRRAHSSCLEYDIFQLGCPLLPPPLIILFAQPDEFPSPLPHTPAAISLSKLRGAAVAHRLPYFRGEATHKPASHPIAPSVHSGSVRETARKVKVARLRLIWHLAPEFATPLAPTMVSGRGESIPHPNRDGRPGA